MLNAVFLDLCKSFDSVNHKLLLNKLSRMSFNANIHSLIPDYFTGRFQYIDVAGFTSDSDSWSTTGLRFEIFYLFFNEILTTKYDGRVLFADDGVFRITDSSFDRLIFKLDILLNDLFQWLSANKLSPNSSKNF